MNGTVTVTAVAPRIQIIAIERATGERTLITDLYWFEENHVHGFDDPRFEFVVIVGAAS